MTFLLLWDCHTSSYGHSLSPYTGSTHFSPTEERVKKVALPFGGFWPSSLVSRAAHYLGWEWELVLEAFSPFQTSISMMQRRAGKQCKPGGQQWLLPGACFASGAQEGGTLAAGAHVYIPKSCVSSTAGFGSCD